MTPIFKKSWSLWRQVWLASSLLEKILKNNSGECSFQSTYHLCSNSNNDSARRNWGQTWSRASTQSNISAKAFVGRPTEGELYHICRMEPVLILSQNNYICLIMPAKLRDILFQPVPVFVGNLAQNSTRLSQSNEPFLLIRSCVFLCSWHTFILLLFHANNTLSITFKHETIAPKIFRCVSFFFQNYAWSHMFTKIFWEFKVLGMRQKSYWCLFKQASSGNSSDSLER